ncbi:hypothetical protein STEG23_029952, partial [Scotinomys teguina]
ISSFPTHSMLETERCLHSMPFVNRMARSKILIRAVDGTHRLPRLPQVGLLPGNTQQCCLCHRWLTGHQNRHLVDTQARGFPLKEAVWKPVAPMLKARTNHASTALNGEIYAIGDVITSPSLPKYLSSPRCAALNGALYLISDNMKKVYVYDPGANLWQKTGHYTSVFLDNASSSSLKVPPALMTPPPFPPLPLLAERLSMEDGRRGDSGVPQELQAWNLLSPTLAPLKPPTPADVFSSCNSQSSLAWSAYPKGVNDPCSPSEGHPQYSIPAALKLALRHHLSAEEQSDRPTSIMARQAPKDPKSQYSLILTIGQGAFSTVKLAYHHLTRTLVAIKEVDNTQKCRQLIWSEVEILQKVQHPNIVRLFEVIETRHRFYVITEYAKGGDLLQQVTEEGRLEEGEAQRVFGQLVSAIKYCHSRDIVHLDLQPDNILLDEEANVKLADFGFATMCRAGTVLLDQCGTKLFNAPEQVLGKGYDGKKVDVWSLGVLLYFITTGYHPFRGSSVEEIEEKITTGSYDFPAHISRSCLLLYPALNEEVGNKCKMSAIQAPESLRKATSDPRGSEKPTTCSEAMKTRPELPVVPHTLGDESVQQEISPFLMAQQGAIDHLACKSFLLPGDPRYFEVIGFSSDSEHLGLTDVPSLADGWQLSGLAIVRMSHIFRNHLTFIFNEEKGFKDKGSSDITGYERPDCLRSEVTSES